MITKPKKGKKNDVEVKPGEPEPGSMEALELKIKQAYPGVVATASKAPVIDVPRFPTGYAALDIAMAGGYPGGRVTLQAGHKGSFKTTAYLRAIARWQRMCHACWGILRAWGDYAEPLREHLFASYGAMVAELLCWCATPLQLWAVWHDQEGVFDEPWALQCGVDTDRLKLVRPETAEIGIDIANEMGHSPLVGLYALDSVAFLTPQKEIEASSAEWQVGLQARLVGKFIRIVTSTVALKRAAGQHMTWFLINQIREKPTGMPGITAHVEPGGHAQTFAASLWLRFRHTGYDWDGVKANATPPKDRPPDTGTMEFTVRASKVSPPSIRGEVTARSTPRGALGVGDGDDAEYLLKQALRYNAVRRHRNRLWIGSRSFPDEATFVSYIEADPLLREVLLRQTVRMAYPMRV